MKISIIIPIYNLENYIGECIESILNQTYQNIELILVNDGSSDNSEKVCKNYKKTDNRIKYYYKNNGGASSARNLGINKATGEYIMFIDGDDYLYDNSVIEKLANEIIKSNKDNNILFYRMATYYDKIKKLEFDSLITKSDKKNCSNKILEELVLNGRLSISPCDKIIKLKYIKDNNIYFDENIKNCEDIDWSFKLYLSNNVYSVTNEVVYVYRKQRENSTTYKITEKKIKSMYDVIYKWYNFKYDSNYLKKIYINYLAYQYSILISIIDKNNCSKSMKKNIYKLNNILDNDLNYKVKKIKKIKKIIGFKLTIFVLKTYIYIKNLGFYRVSYNEK